MVVLRLKSERNVSATDNHVSDLILENNYFGRLFTPCEAIKSRDISPRGENAVTA
jgi:hypothetical protein